MPIIPLKSSLWEFAAPRDARYGTGGAGGKEDRVVCFRRMLGLDLTRLVAVVFFGALDFGVAVCAEAVVEVAAAMMAVVASRVRSRMVGTYPE